MKKHKEQIMQFREHIDKLRNRLLYVLISILLFGGESSGNLICYH